MFPRDVIVKEKKQLDLAPKVGISLGLKLTMKYPRFLYGIFQLTPALHSAYMKCNLSDTNMKQKQFLGR